MEIKETVRVFVYFKQIITTLKELNNIVGNTPGYVAQELLKKGYKIIGPQIWNYDGIDGNPDSKFTLEICFPVDNISESKDPNTKYLSAFKSACLVQKGPWSELPKVYSVLIDEMGAKGYKPSNRCREVYHVCDFVNPENCITEIQLGVQ